MAEEQSGDSLKAYWAVVEKIEMALRELRTRSPMRTYEAITVLHQGLREVYTAHRLVRNAGNMERWVRRGPGSR